MEKEASRSRSRSPVTFNQNNESEAKDNIGPTENQSNQHSEKVFKWHLAVSNCPLNWNHPQAKEYIFDAIRTKHEDISDITVFYKHHLRIASIKCTTSKLANNIYQMFNHKIVKGQKLHVTKRPYKKNVPDKAKVWSDSNVKKIAHLFNMYNKCSDDETYGLSDQLLQHFGIHPPLLSRVFIKNLAPEVDEPKLVEVFNLAGKVIDFKLMKHTDGTSKGIASVTYDHPVEAVQAISMFNKQWLWGKQMDVDVDKIKKKKSGIIPKGLSGIGLGLGENGNPLQHVRARIQIEQLKHDIKEWLSCQTNIEQNTTNSSNTQYNPNDGVNPASSLANDVNPNPAVNSNVQTLLQGLMQQANPVNAVAQNPLQSFLALLANMGNQSTNQTLPVLTNQFLNSPQSQVAPNVNNQQSPSGINPQMQTNLVNQSIPLTGVKTQVPSMIPVNQHIPPNLANQHMPENLANQYIPANLVNRHIPPTLVNQQILVNRQNPLNLHHQQIPPNFYNLQLGQHPPYHTMNPQNAGSPNVGSVKDSLGDMVVFRNLPTSVCIEALKGKMQEVGQVMFAEMMGDGKAIVRFGNESQAEECIRLFDGCKVDGQLISVLFA